MVNLETGIDSLTNFKRQSAEYIGRLRKSGEPLVLTVNGKAEVVVQDAAAYQRLVELAASAERAALLAAVKEGLADLDAGRGMSAKQVFRDMAKKHGYTPRPD
jgi:prevent-host-death family protein